MILSTNICKNKKDDKNQKHSSKKNHRLSYQPERGTKSHNLDITRLKINHQQRSVCYIYAAFSLPKHAASLHNNDISNWQPE